MVKINKSSLPLKNEKSVAIIKATFKGYISMDIITVDLKYSNTMQPQQHVPIFNCFQNRQVHSNQAYNELHFLVSTKSEGSSKMLNVYE